MHESTAMPEWGNRIYDDASDKIIDTLNKNPKTRKDAKAIIDMINRTGDPRYRDLYEEYS